jgi:hypothetical protein
MNKLQDNIMFVIHTQGNVSNCEPFLEQMGAEYDFNADELFQQRLQPSAVCR